MPPRAAGLQAAPAGEGGAQEPGVRRGRRGRPGHAGLGAGTGGAAMRAAVGAGAGPGWLPHGTTARGVAMIVGPHLTGRSRRLTRPLELPRSDAGARRWWVRPA